jgi:hypothetical protein
LAVEPTTECIGYVVGDGVADDSDDEDDGGDCVGAAAVEICLLFDSLLVVPKDAKRDVFRPFQHFDVAVAPMAMPVRVEGDVL